MIIKFHQRYNHTSGHIRRTRERESEIEIETGRQRAIEDIVRQTDIKKERQTEISIGN